MSYFKKVVADDGTESFIEVDFETEELPKELVVKSKAYKEVQESDFKRRKRIEKMTSEQAELQKRLTSAGAEVITTEEDEPEKPVVPETPVVPVINEDELYTKFINRMTAEQQAAAQAAQAKTVALRGIAKANGLSAKAASILALSNDPEAMAKELAAQQYRFDDVEGGDVQPENDEVFMDGVFKNLGI